MGNSQTRNLVKWAASRLWIAPVVGALLACMLAAGAMAVDHFVDWQELPVPVFKGAADTARSFLNVIATSAATLIALIFNVIAVVIQLAMRQYSPRALGLLIQDRPTHFTVGIFIGTFTYALVVLMALRLARGPDNDDEAVASLAVTIAFVLAVLSLGTFAVYSNHIIHTTRVSSIVRRLGAESRRSIDRNYPNQWDGPEDDPQLPNEPPDQVLPARQSGAVVGVDEQGLLDRAAAAGLTVRLIPPIGSFVPQGAPLFHVHGGRDDSLTDLARIRDERNMEQDPAYGLRQLVDIATRALSPGINDPSTAVQVIDELHGLLRLLCDRQLLARCEQRQEAGRLLVHWPTWEELLDLAVVEIRLYGAGSPQVTRRLLAMLEDLAEAAPAPRADAVRAQMQTLRSKIDEQFKPGSASHRTAAQADPRGLGF